MISYLISILKIILGSIIAHYFHAPLIGGWWVGVLLFISSISNICSFSRKLLFGNILFNMIVLIISTLTVIYDCEVANYFIFQRKKCNFQDSDDFCYCSRTKDLFGQLSIALTNHSCGNLVVRNPQLFILNAALSILCLISSLILTIFLCLAAGLLLRNRPIRGVQEFTIPKPQILIE